MSLKTATPMIVSIWKIWAHFTGMAVISLGIGAGLVQAVSGNDAVVTVTEVRNETKSAPYRGRYGYAYDLERHESCPGEVVIIFSKPDASSPTVVTLRKPSVLLEPKTYTDVRIDNPLPDSITPGRWLVDTSLVSHCPNRERTDPIAKFEIEVTATS